MAWRIKTKEEMPSGAHWAESGMDYLYGESITDDEAKRIMDKESYHKSWRPELADGEDSYWTLYPNMIQELSEIKVGDIVKYDRENYADYEFEVLEINCNGQNASCYSKAFSNDGRGHSGNGAATRKNDQKGHWNINIKNLKLIKQLHNDTDVRTIDQRGSYRGSETRICSSHIKTSSGSRPVGSEAASFTIGISADAGKIKQNIIQLD